MGAYQQFKTVIYCHAGSMEHITEEELRAQIAFFQKYVEVDKVYLEPYRDDRLISREQLHRLKRVFAEAGIETAGGITTTIGDITEADRDRQRIFHVFCYSAPHMRERLKEIVTFIASEFDEIIIDDFYFTNCTCDDCRRAKGDRSWEAFRLELMAEVSQNLVIAPAREVNPNIRLTIKYPNWMESYQETGYNPGVQKDQFDSVYTGTENRHPRHTNQHLPRYKSYSLMRYMENLAPGRNGGGWFDPFQCYPIDCYLEQMYLTVLSRPREVMMFCWAALYQNKVITPMGFQLHRLDALMGQAGKCQGLATYIPVNGQGEDHLEDYLGMCGIPLESTPDFPAHAPALFLTVAALQDARLVEKLERYVAGGGKAIVTSGFVQQALREGRGMEQMTSLRDRGRRFVAEEYMVEERGALYRCAYVKAHQSAGYPLLENRNNATWCIICAMHGDENCGLMMEDTYGKGKLITLVVPDNYADLKHWPPEVLTRVRMEMSEGNYAYLDAPSQLSLFTYDNEAFALYSYTADLCQPEVVRVRVKGEAASLTELEHGKTIEPLHVRGTETVFELDTLPGEFRFYRVNRGNRT